MQRKFSGELHKVRQHMCFKLTYIFNLMLDEFIIQCFAQANRKIIIKYYFKLFIDLVTDHRQQFRSRGFTKKKVCKHDRRFYNEMYGRREKKIENIRSHEIFFSICRTRILIPQVKATYFPLKFRYGPKFSTYK